MATPYEIAVTMTGDTVNALNNGNYKLVGFKSVQTDTGGGIPVVWFTSTTFATTTKVQWLEQYQGYTTYESAIPGGSVTGDNAYNMNLGEKLVIDSTAGTGEVYSGGAGNFITIENISGVPFVSGISQEVTDPNGTSTANPMCAFNLYGTTTLQIAPIEEVLLMFATTSLNTGSVVYNAFTTGVLVNLTASSQRSVAFDINTGWNWGKASWGQSVSNNADLAPLLIDTPSSNATSLLTRNNHRRKIALVA